MTKTKLTKEIEQALVNKAMSGNFKNTYGALEVPCGQWLGKGHQNIDFATYAPATQEIVCYEIKVTMSDFNSHASLSFYGNKNYLVMPYDHRSKFVKLLKRNDYNILLAEHKDRITRFGYNYLSILLARCGIQLQVINQIDNKDQELLDDFISLVTSFCNRIYGRRRKDKTQKIIKDIQHENQVK